MKLKKMLKLLKDATEKNSDVYNQEELDYMKNQLQTIEGELKRLEHKDYRGFGKKV